MNDKIFFDNTIAYMVVGPSGEISQQGEVKNQTAARLKDKILLALTLPNADNGSLVGINEIAFRTDGSAILGTFLTWTSSTAFSTRYNNATYLNSVNFNSTYTATANVNIKTISCLDHSGILFAVTDDVASFCHLYSTNLNMSVGSAGKIIIQWTVSM
jgi:hypothetical protein